MAEADLAHSQHFPHLTPHGLTVLGQPTQPEWHAFGETVRTLGESAAWGTADWLAYGDEGRDWTAEEAADLLAMAPPEGVQAADLNTIPQGF